MKCIPVESSWVASVGYDGASSTLEIVLCDGHVYRYFEVPERHFLELTSGAGSVGRYLNRHIRDAYRYRRVR